MDASTYTLDFWRSKASGLKFRTQHFIDGAYVASADGRTYPTINPATGATIAEVARGGAAEIDRAVAAARKAYRSGAWSRMDPRARMAVLEKFSALIEAHAEEFAVLDSLDMGKPVMDMMNIDIPGSVTSLKFFAETIDKIVRGAGFKTAEAGEICRIGLANYYAGALQMPYGAFLAAADSHAYDIEQLAFTFGASLEQVGHRLSTMQRPKARGVPFFFARVDAAGTITKRHSATPLQFPRFGGACPLWNVHRAFEAHGQIMRQLAETPDGNRYLCLAWSEEKRIGGFRGPVRRYAFALGCEIAHAGRLTYAADLNLDRPAAFEPIGISCRICPRGDCLQRSVPPLDARLTIDADSRAVVPYRLG